MYILATILFVIALAPLFLAGKMKTAKGKKRAVIANIASVCFVVALMFSIAILTVSAESEAEVFSGEVISSGGLTTGSGLGFIAAALAVGLSGLGAGIAVASSASAAIGAISENPSVFVQALIFVALAEGVALYGLLIAFQILSKL